MNRLIWMLLLCLPLFAASCKNRCESQKTGEIALLDSSAGLIPYEDGNQITLKNEDGESMVLSMDVNQSMTDQHCVKYRCELTTGPYEPVVCDYYTSESISQLLYIGDSIVIDVLVYMALYEEEKELFYDALRLSMSKIGSLAFGETVLAPRFDDPPFDESQTNFSDELVLEEFYSFPGNQVYQNVWRTAEGPNMLFARPDLGLFAIKLDGEFWLME
ncbi:MAG: hypothetical protein GYB31_17200 [Bacteroidetes bacterium]|nr:hypothetical protein [Bacteroidota bacterium]